MRLPYTSTAATFAATLSVLLPVIAGYTGYDIDCKADWPSESGNYKGPPPGYVGLIPRSLSRRDAGTSIDLSSLFDCSRFGDDKGRETCEAHLEARNNTTTLVKKSPLPSPQIPEIEDSPGPCCIFTFECVVFVKLRAEFIGEDADKAMCCLANYETTCDAPAKDPTTGICYPPLCSNGGNTCKDDIPVEVWTDLGLTWGEVEQT